MFGAAVELELLHVLERQLIRLNGDAHMILHEQHSTTNQTKPSQTKPSQQKPNQTKPNQHNQTKTKPTKPNTTQHNHDPTQHNPNTAQHTKHKPNETQHNNTIQHVKSDRSTFGAKDRRKKGRRQSKAKREFTKQERVNKARES